MGSDAIDTGGYNYNVKNERVTNVSAYEGTSRYTKLGDSNPTFVKGAVLGNGPV